MTTRPTDRRMKTDYGIDAPGILFGLAGGGVALVTVGVATAALATGAGAVAGLALCGVGAIPLFFGVLMAIYALFGKTRTRDHMLDRVAWRGDELVLDVGTGAGLLLVGAAKRLDRGRVVGIDLWAAKDLSRNAVDATERNAAIEGVADRVAILTADARDLPFPDRSFDVVLSLLCLHNIEPLDDRLRACREIARLLAPGGLAVLGDYVPTHRYAEALAGAGLTVVQSKAAFSVAWSLTWIVVAEKAGASGASRPSVDREPG